MKQSVGQEKHINDLTVSKFKTLMGEAIKETIEDLVENREAHASSNFLNAIKDARQEYKAGKTKLFDV